MSKGYTGHCSLTARPSKALISHCLILRASRGSGCNSASTAPWQPKSEVLIILCLYLGGFVFVFTNYAVAFLSCWCVLTSWQFALWLLSLKKEEVVPPFPQPWPNILRNCMRCFTHVKYLVCEKLDLTTARVLWCDLICHISGSTYSYIVGHQRFLSCLAGLCVEQAA